MPFFFFFHAFCFSTACTSPRQILLVSFRFLVVGCNGVTVTDCMRAR